MNKGEKFVNTYKEISFMKNTFSACNRCLKSLNTILYIYKINHIWISHYV